jgi:hypothetical protein
MELGGWCAWAGEICSNSCLLAGGTKLDKEPARRPAVSLAFPSSRLADVGNVSPLSQLASNRNQSNVLRHWRPAARLPTRPYEAAIHNFTNSPALESHPLLSSFFDSISHSRHAPSLSSIISWFPSNHHTTCHPPHP